MELRPLEFISGKAGLKTRLYSRVWNARLYGNAAARRLVS